MGIDPATLAIGALVGSAVMEGTGQVVGYGMKSAQADRAVKIGKIKADQTHAASAAELNRTLSNIRSIRASSGTSASPTEAAILAKESDVSQSNLRKRMASIRLQQEEDKSAKTLYGVSAGLALGNTLFKGAQAVYGG